MDKCPHSNFYFCSTFELFLKFEDVWGWQGRSPFVPSYPKCHWRQGWKFEGWGGIPLEHKKFNLSLQKTLK
jgi:hypothetical protein